MIRIEIKNKGLFIKNAAAVSFIALLFFLFLWGLKINSRLTQELAVKNSEHRGARSASKRLKGLQKQFLALEQKEKTMGLRVPVDEKYPFSLIRTLTSIAGEIGLKNPSFAVKRAPDSPVQTSDDKLTQEAGLSEAAGILASSSLPPGPRPVRIEMDFTATYRQLLKFLDRLANLERIVAAEEIKIERDKKTLPRQRISLQLVTYLF